jgi:serine/threonine protein kinase
MATSYCPACLNTFQGAPARCPNLGCGSARPGRGWGRILGPGDLIDRHYRIERVLALGGAGLTYLARAIDSGGHPIEPPLAIKVLFEERASGGFLRRLANEAQLLQDLDHDHIVRCRGFVQRAGQAPYLVTLFEAGGTLQDHVQRVGPLPAPVAAGVLEQVLKALSMAHASGVVHRDLKPANVLLAEGCEAPRTPWVRVADFGIAKVSAPIGAGLTQAGSFIGTPEYAAPEQLEGQPPVPATDLFAAGGLLFFMLTGRPPIRPDLRGDPLAVFEQLLEQLPPQLPPLGLEDDDQRRLQRVLDNVAISSVAERWSVPRILEELRPLRQRPARPANPPPPPRAAGPGSAEPTIQGWIDPAPAAAPKLGAYDATIIEPPPPEARGPSTPAAAGDATIIEPVPRPPAAEPTAQDLSLDDLFAAPRPVKRGPPPQALTLDDLFGGPSAQPQEQSDLEDFAMQPAGSRHTRQEPADHRTLPTGWTPSSPRALPHPLPAAPAALLELVGSVRPEDRRAPLDALGALPRPELARALRAWRPGDDPARGRGVGLAIAALGGADLASIARGLTRAKDASVRACAAEALGAVAAGSLLATLGRMVGDTDPEVRSAAAIAIGQACARTGDQALGRSWLQRLTEDRDERVALALERAHEALR